MKKHLLISLLLSPLALTASTIWQTSFDIPDYVVGELNGQQSWSYTPSGTRLQSSFVTVSDSSSIGALSVNERHVFIDANRTAAPSNSRRMDQTASLALPVSLNNSVNYLSFRVALGNSGSADNSEIFFAVSDAGLFGGTYIALKMASQSNPGTNILEIGGASGNGNTQVNPAPALSQATLYWMTLGTTVTGGQITEINGWLNPTLVDGVPVGPADVSQALVTPLAISNTLHLRAQNQPTAITDIVVAIPEPTTYALMFGALALAFVAIRRRK